MTSTDAKADEQIYRFFFEGSPALFAILGTDGRFERANASLEKAFGTSADRLRSTRLVDWIDPIDRGEAATYLQSAAAGQVIHAVHLFCDAQGNSHRLSWMARTVEGRILWAARVIGEEFAEVQRVERERLLSVFAKAPAPICILRGPELRIQFVNDAFMKVVGQQRSVMDRPIRESFPDIQPELLDILEKVYTTQTRYIGSEVPVQLDWEGSGRISTRHYTLVWEPTLDANGKVDGVMSFGFDVSDQIEARRILQSTNDELEKRVAERTLALTASNRELEAFSYSVSHDLRSPLRGIAGFSQALLEDYDAALDDTGKRYLRYIQQGIQKMSELIDDLLSLSRLSRTSLSTDTIDLSNIARDLAQELKSIEPGRSVEFEIEPELVTRGDPGLMRIALQNLLGNAWKFTRKNAHAKIRIGRCLHEGKPAFFVADDGAGFDMAYIGKLFGAFQRLHSPDDGYAGSGIGLATVRRIIHRHGGSIWAEAAVGKGATFYFTLS